MGEEKEKIQQPDIGQGKEIEQQTAESQEKGKNKKSKNALIGTIISWVLIGIYLGVAIPLNNKFENFSTHWLLFGLFALIIPCGTFNFMVQGLALKDIPKEKQVNAARRLIIFTFYLWFVDLFYMVSFNNWLVWIYILGIILLLIAISNLIKVFLGKTEVFKKFILGDLLIALVLTAFLIYKIPEKYGSLQSIVTTIVAAVYGGMLTLTGVAWTIKRQDEIRKEEEKKKMKPYLRLLSCYDKNIKSIDISWRSFYDVDRYGIIISDEEHNIIKNSKKLYVRIGQFRLQQTSDNLCKLICLKIDDVTYELREKRMVAKNDDLLFCLDIIGVDSFEKVSLIVEDICGNRYSYAIKYKFYEPWKFMRKGSNDKDLGVVFKDGLSYSNCEFFDIGMPEEIEKEEK